MWWFLFYVIIGYSLAIVTLDDYGGPAWKESGLTLYIMFLWPVIILGNKWIRG